MAGPTAKDLLVSATLKLLFVPVSQPDRPAPPRKPCVIRSANLSKNFAAPSVPFWGAKANVEAKFESPFLINSRQRTKRSNDLRRQLFPWLRPVSVNPNHNIQVNTPGIPYMACRLTQA